MNQNQDGPSVRTLSSAMQGPAMAMGMAAPLPSDLSDIPTDQLKLVHDATLAQVGYRKQNEPLKARTLHMVHLQAVKNTNGADTLLALSSCGKLFRAQHSTGGTALTDMRWEMLPAPELPNEDYETDMESWRLGVATDTEKAATLRAEIEKRAGCAATAEELANTETATPDPEIPSVAQEQAQAAAPAPARAKEQEDEAQAAEAVAQEQQKTAGDPADLASQLASDADQPDAPADDKG